MNILKVLVTIFLCFLLFVSLSVFGVMFMLQNTIFNADFVISQTDRVDISDLAREIVEEYIDEDIPEEAEFIKDIIYDVIAEEEPWIREQLEYAVRTGYDFLQEKTEKLEIIIPMEGIIADIKESLWDTLKERQSEWLPEIVDVFLVPYVSEHLDEYADSIPNQYIPSFVIDAAEELLFDYLEDYLQDVSDEIMNEGSMSEITGLLEALVKPYYDYYYDEFIEEIPSEIIINEDEITDDVMDGLLEARKYLGYFQAGFWGLIGFMVVLVAGVILIHRNVKTPSLSLGITTAFYGALTFIGVLIARSINPMQYIPDSSEIPASLETLIHDIPRDIMAPLQWFSLGILIIGVALIVLSILYRSRVVED
jgi:hypothetical protein